MTGHFLAGTGGVCDDYHTDGDRHWNILRDCVPGPGKQPHQVHHLRHRDHRGQCPGGSPDDGYHVPNAGRPEDGGQELPG